MSATQREGLIILLPKGDKSKKLTRKLAWITLFNEVYKLALAATATRVKNDLPKLIHSDQCGLMACRFTRFFKYTMYSSRRTSKKERS